MGFVGVKGPEAGKVGFEYHAAEFWLYSWEIFREGNIVSLS